MRIAAILINDDRILLLQKKRKKVSFMLTDEKRIQTIEHDTYEEKPDYFFPSGTTQENENIQDCLTRILQKGTTITSHVDRLIYFQRSFGDDNDAIIDTEFYLCSYVAGDMQSTNGDATMTWVSIDELSQIVLYPMGIADILQKDFKDNFQECPKKVTTTIDAISV